VTCEGEFYLSKERYEAIVININSIHVYNYEQVDINGIEIIIMLTTL